MQRLSRILAITLVLLLCLSFSLAFAETYYVYTSNGKTLNLRSPEDNSIIAHIPYGTAVTPDENLSTEKSAYVTYNGVSGYASWRYLVREMPTKKTSSKKSSPTSTPLPQTGEGEYMVSVTGGYIQYTGKTGKGTGTKYASVSFDDAQDLSIHASVPKGKKLDYWLIDGLAVSFGTSSSFRLPQVSQSVVIEAVFK